ncbi:2-succinyl-5-enolpyruvyl-6-hydroxy-3-cyclohexene-1-carboxylic-acid synthase [Ornithinimicrobium sp. LYQ121]|uniref:2-succinyl-5-enolpyruvyl-6-hydroxy-3- cyclohexene-1-carboxylic-acid synthase n=1 Tax=Ornithinimicrobium sp. LYQ121 TaxID=3378801 RepID=UPI0038531AC1
MHPSTALATVLVDELVRGGVREAVLCPGSRSAPLAYAFEEADRSGRLRLHVRVDERSAAFLALGIARSSGLPVPVVTTSGTAVANLHPAVLEAHHSGIPLVVVSADRPTELRGTGANQTTVQPGMFGGAVRWEVDLPAPDARPGQVGAWRSTVCRALAAALDAAGSGGWVRSGPVHLNVALRDPLAPDLDDTTGWGEALDGRADGGPWVRVGSRDDDGDPRTVVLLGDLTDPAVTDLALSWAAASGWPVLAEPFGRLPSGPTVVPHGVLVAADTALVDELAPGRVVVVGRLTLFRELGALLRRPGVVVEHVTGAPSWTDPSHVVGLVRPVTDLQRAERSADPSWAQRWVAAGESLSAAVREAAGLGSAPGPDASPHLTSVGVAVTVASLLGEADTLVLGSSNAPRDLALGLGALPQPARPVVVGNRGLAGIDGTVSTAVGVALAQAAQGHRDGGGGSAGRTVALMGDLTFLHDTNGLLVGPDEPRPDLTIVVVNDDGGGIFSTLEYGAPERSATPERRTATERLFGTPHGTDLQALCAAHHVGHVRVGTLAELAAVLAERGGLRVVEVAVDRWGHRALRDVLRRR